MILQSGIVPYGYDLQLPFLGECPSGLPGILIEKAMWVAVAEKRRLLNDDLSDVDLAQFSLFTHGDGTNDPLGFVENDIEPTPGADIFDSRLSPSGAIFALPLDYIVDLRRYLTSQVFNKYDTDYSNHFVEADFLNNFYPGSSGQVAANDPAQNLNAHSRQEQSLPFALSFPFPSIPAFVFTTDINTLGGSGILFDRDFGETIFNPYPNTGSTKRSFLINTNGIADSRGRAQFLTAPFFPMFQKTNGSLVTPNSRDLSSGYVLAFNPDEVDISEVNSGRVKLNGDLLFSDTEYKIGTQDITTETYDTDFVDHFSFVSSSDRVIAGTKRVDSTRVFLTPSAKAAGVYRTSVVNRKSDFPNAGIESGVISSWPRPSGLFPIKESNTQQLNNGYEVFDECFWFNEGSGLAAVSPFTGRAMWVRSSEQTVMANATGTHTWREDMVGLKLIGNIIYKASDITNTTGDRSMVLGRWNSETLDFVDDIAGNTTASSQTITDFDYDGSIFYLIDNSFSNNEIFLFDNTFTFLRSYEATGQDFEKTKIFAIDNSILCKRINNLNTPADLVPVGFPTGTSTPTLGTFKSITNFMGPAIRDVYDMEEVTTATQINNGVWAAVNVSGITSGSSGALNNIGVVRIEEMPTEWIVREMYIVENFNFEQQRNINMIFKSIN